MNDINPLASGMNEKIAEKSCVLSCKNITKIYQQGPLKADVLDNFKDLKVCTAYNINGAHTDEVPFQLTRVAAEPVYKNFAGWNTDSTQIKDAAQLPADMSTYIEFINNYVGAPVKYVSNGPGREQIIHL